MSILSRLFRPGAIRPGVGDRVQHVNTKRLGTVTGRATISGSTKVWALTVAYDDGTIATQVPENEFIKVDAKTRALLHPRRTS